MPLQHFFPCRLNLSLMVVIMHHGMFMCMYLCVRQMMVAHIMYPFNVVANVMAVNNSGSVYARPDLYMNYATC